MATATPEQIIALTTAHRATQAREAAKIAALTAVYFQKRVNVEDPSSIERWLSLLLPRILGARGKSATVAAQYGNAIRRLELPKVSDDFRFVSGDALPAAVVRTSLSVVGPQALRKRIAAVEKLDEKPAMKQALLEEAMTDTLTAVAGATARHIQNGGRDALFRGVKEDPRALGYVRVTKGNPCYFCAMLATRGLVFAADSFEESNARFTGEHNVKVHDSCACSLKPAYSRDDPVIDLAADWLDLWKRTGARKSGPAAVKAFRQAYEGRAA